MATRKRKNKKVTLSEFKAWLEGVEEMQGDDWIPTDAQWKRIREKIDSIVPEIVEKKNTVKTPDPRMAAAPSPTPPSAPPVHQSALDITPPPPPSNAPIANTDGGQVKTPDIDTSDGKYTSSFV